MTRRAYRRGGIDWLGPNKAKIRIRTAPDPLTGKRRQVSRIVYGTPDEVETAMLQLRLLHSYGPIVQTDFTVDQMIEVHLSTPKRDGTERASSARYKDRSRYRLHLQPTFGKRQAGAVTPQELTIHYDQLLQNLKPNTVRLIHALIRSAYGSAIERGLLESNPATKARCPTVKEPAPVAPSVTSVEAHYRILLKSDPDMALVVRLAACLGIRRAEILALKWNHIDLESASLVITDGLINTPGIGQEITETKTGRFGWAEFPLDEQLVGELTDQRTRLEKNAAQVGVSPPDNGYVFSNSPLGESAWHPDTPSKRLRRHMLSHPEIPPFTLKNLRAFVSTEVIARGASLQSASAILRHESTQTTAKYYNAVREDAARSAVLDLQKIF